MLLERFWNSGIAVIAVAAFIFSCSTVAVKVTTLPGFEVAFIPSLTCWLILTAYSLLARCCCSNSAAGTGASEVKAPMLGAGGTTLTKAGRRGVLVTPASLVLGLTILRGVLGAANLTLFYLSLDKLDIGMAVTLFFSSPVMAVVLEWLMKLWRVRSRCGVQGAELTWSDSGKLTSTSGAWVADVGAVLSATSTGQPEHNQAPSIVSVKATPCVHALEDLSDEEWALVRHSSVRQSSVVTRSSYRKELQAGDGLTSVVSDSSDDDYSNHGLKPGEGATPEEAHLGLRTVVGCLFTVLGVVLVSQPSSVFGTNHSRQDFMPKCLMNMSSCAGYTGGGGVVSSPSIYPAFHNASSSSSSMGMSTRAGRRQLSTLVSEPMQEVMHSWMARDEESDLDSTVAVTENGEQWNSTVAWPQKTSSSYRWVMSTVRNSSMTVKAASAAVMGASIMALCAALFNAAAFVTVGLLQGQQSAFNLTWWYHLTVCTFTAVPLLLHFPKAPQIPSSIDWIYLSFITFGQLAGQLLLNRGFSLVSASRGAAVNVIQVLFSYIWEMLLLGGSMDVLAGAGAACVMAGVIIVATDNSHK